MLSCGPFEKDFLRRIALVGRDGVPATLSLLKNVILILTPFYNPGRRQYDGNKLLHHLSQAVHVSEYDKLIGLFKVDLFIPILTLYFRTGDAGRDGPPLPLIYRLRNELYGLETG